MYSKIAGRNTNNQRFQEAGRGRRTRLGFENDSGNLAGILVEQRLETGEIVIAERPRQIGDGLRHSSPHRRRADEPVAGREERMVRAHGDAIAPRERARQPDRRVHRVRAVLGKLHHVAADQLEKRLGCFQFEKRGTAEVGSQLHLTGGGVIHGTERVAERHGSQSHAVLEILVAVDIPHARILAPDQNRQHVGGILVVTLGVGMSAAGNETVQTLGQRERQVEAAFFPRVGHRKQRVMKLSSTTRPIYGA